MILLLSERRDQVALLCALQCVQTASPRMGHNDPYNMLPSATAPGPTVALATEQLRLWKLP